MKNDNIRKAICPLHRLYKRHHAGQVSVFIMTLLFLYYNGPEVFHLFKKNKVPFRFMLLASFRGTTFHSLSV